MPKASIDGFAQSDDILEPTHNTIYNSNPMPPLVNEWEAIVSFLQYWNHMHLKRQRLVT